MSRVNFKKFILVGIFLLGMVILLTFLTLPEIKKTLIGFNLLDAGSRSVEAVNELKLSRDRCSQESETEKCYLKETGLLLGRFNFKELLLGFSLIEEKEPGGSYSVLLENIARGETRGGSDISSVLKQCTLNFSYACFDGSVLGYFDRIKINGVDSISQAVRETCSTLKDSKGTYGKCIHGIGRGLVLVSAKDLIGTIKLCDYVNSDQTLILELARSSCYDGVFSESASRGLLPISDKNNLEDPNFFYPCNELAENYLNSCYRFLITHLSSSNKIEWPELMRICSKMPKSYNQTCYRTLGLSVSDNPSYLSRVEACNLLPAATSRKQCVVGLVHYFSTKYFSNEQLFFGMFDICGLVESIDKEICYRRIGHNLRSWTADTNKHEQACARIEAVQYRTWCLEGDTE